MTMPTRPWGIPLCVPSLPPSYCFPLHPITVQRSERWDNMLICDWLIATRRPTHCYLLTATIDQRRRRVTQYRRKLTPSHRLSVGLFHFARHPSTSSFHSCFDSPTGNFTIIIHTENIHHGNYTRKRV